VSLPAAPIALDDCHTVPVLFVKKWRVPVVAGYANVLSHPVDCTDAVFHVPPVFSNARLIVGNATLHPVADLNIRFRRDSNNRGMSR